MIRWPLAIVIRGAGGHVKCVSRATFSQVAPSVVAKNQDCFLDQLSPQFNVLYHVPHGLRGYRFRQPLQGILVSCTATSARQAGSSARTSAGPCRIGRGRCPRGWGWQRSGRDDAHGAGQWLLHAGDGRRGTDRPTGTDRWHDRRWRFSVPAARATAVNAGLPGRQQLTASGSELGHINLQFRQSASATAGSGSAGCATATAELGSARSRNPDAQLLHGTGVHPGAGQAES